MKNLILLLSLNVLVSCASLQGDALMDELQNSATSDQARMAELGYQNDSGSEMVFIDPTDRFLLQEDFDCKETKIAMAYCQH